MSRVKRKVSKVKKPEFNEARAIKEQLLRGEVLAEAKKNIIGLLVSYTHHERHKILSMVRGFYDEVQRKNPKDFEYEDDED